MRVPFTDRCRSQDDRRTHFFERYGFQILDKKRITKFDRHQDETVYVATLYKVFDD